MKCAVSEVKCTHTYVLKASDKPTGKGIRLTKTEAKKYLVEKY